MTDYSAYDRGLPCKNLNCKSYGHPHPNCRCYGGGYAKGGSVCAQRIAHEKGCEFYAAGGTVSAPTQGQDDTPATVGHAAIEHGLLGLLKSVGRTGMASPNDHRGVLEDARDAHLSAGQPELDPDAKPSVGRNLGQHLFHGRHEDAAELLHGHALIGQVPKGHLKPILERLSGPVKEKGADPEAFRASAEYLSSAAKGASRLDHHVKDLFGKSNRVEPDEKAHQALGEHLEELRENPSRMFDVGGSLGHYLPEHAASLAAHSATAIEYLNQIKPKRVQKTPLDEPSPIDPLQEDAYNRALAVAQQPLSVLQSIHDGTLQPNDMIGLAKMYPGLYKSIKTKLGEELINLKTKGEDLSYKHALSLSLALGQPLDGTMTAESMMAIIKSQAPAQASQGPQKKSSSGATAATQKTIEKVDQLYETPLDHLAEHHSA